MMIEIFRGWSVSHDGAYENYGVLHGRKYWIRMVRGHSNGVFRGKAPRTPPDRG